MVWQRAHSLGQFLSFAANGAGFHGRTCWTPIFVNRLPRANGECKHGIGPGSVR